MTRPLRAMVVDDEPLARRGLCQLAEAHGGVVVVAECRNGREALARLDEAAPDVVFLDVQMPGTDGFAVLHGRGAAPMPPVVFVTAYDAHAVRAFEANALDYLLKPVTAARFALTIARVRERRAGQGPLRLSVPTGAGSLLVDPAEIDWIEADDYYAALHVGRRRHLLRESLSSLAVRLRGTSLVRAHRRAIVNLALVRELRAGRGGSVLVLRDGTEVPVSRRCRRAVDDALRRLARGSA
jgi:two-component system, LytTR family, response regulator